jgi:hypothetical protein
MPFLNLLEICVYSPGGLGKAICSSHSAYDQVFTTLMQLRKHCPKSISDQFFPSENFEVFLELLMQIERKMLLHPIL